MVMTNEVMAQLIGLILNRMGSQAFIVILVLETPVIVMPPVFLSREPCSPTIIRLGNNPNPYHRFGTVGEDY
jgi:hypothetical protein